MSAGVNAARLADESETQCCQTVWQVEGAGRLTSSDGTQTDDSQEFAMSGSNRLRASSDYERPEQDVADLPDPVVLSTNKARQSVKVRGMWIVLAIGTALAAVAVWITYLVG